MCVLLLFSAKLYYLCPAFDDWSDARVAEEARLESVYTSKAYPEFESRSLRPKRGRQPLSPLFSLQQMDCIAAEVLTDCHPHCQRKSSAEPL